MSSRSRQRSPGCGVRLWVGPWLPSPGSVSILRCLELPVRKTTKPVPTTQRGGVSSSPHLPPHWHLSGVCPPTACPPVCLLFTLTGLAAPGTEQQGRGKQRSAGAGGGRVKETQLCSSLGFQRRPGKPGGRATVEKPLQRGPNHLEGSPGWRATHTLTHPFPQTPEAPAITPVLVTGPLRGVRHQLPPPAGSAPLAGGQA